MDTQPLLLAGQWHAAEGSSGRFRAVDPATGEAIGPAFPVSGESDLEAALTSACAVAGELAAAHV